jgi:hypothetical protein
MLLTQCHLVAVEQGIIGYQQIAYSQIRIAQRTSPETLKTVAKSFGVPDAIVEFFAENIIGNGQARAEAMLTMQRHLPRVAPDTKG